MATTLTIQVPDELFEQLRRQSVQQGRAPEAVAAHVLARILLAPADPVLRWAGAFASGVPDAAERHDEYLRRALYEELQRMLERVCPPFRGAPQP